MAPEAECVARALGTCRKVCYPPRQSGWPLWGLAHTFCAHSSLPSILHAGSLLSRDHRAGEPTQQQILVHSRLRCEGAQGTAPLRQRVRRGHQRSGAAERGDEAHGDEERDEAHRVCGGHALCLAAAGGCGGPSAALCTQVFKHVACNSDA
eukprot:2293153-Pleurochrysis_carterae.AAC.2